MNTPLRRVGLAMLAMIVLLLVDATYIQIVKADEYRKDNRNSRVLLEEYARERGQIIVDQGTNVLALAKVQATNDRLRYLRVYTNGPLYASVTGFYSDRYGAIGIERAEDDILNGSDDRLFVRRLSDLITGRDPRGGNVKLTIDPAVQQAAYDGMTGKNFTGAVVALKPDTGEILAMVSTPSYDPNPLSSHNSDVQEQAYAATNTELKPRQDKAIEDRFPPGSTFKLVVAAAALADGRNKDTQLTAASSIQINSNTDLENFAGSHCGPGDADTVSMATAIQYSCNTAFATLAHDLGEDKIRNQAAKFGIGDDGLTVPMPVVPSCIGPAKSGNCLNIDDGPALYQSGIGQKDVALTPLQNAEIAATIANRGQRMRPQLVRQILAPDLSVISDFSPDAMGQAMDGSNADELRDMMILSEQHTGGDGKDPNLVIASKTGTAETGNDPKNTPPYAWYVAFAPADHPKVAVAVMVKSTDVAATGGKLCASIGRATIAAALAGGR